MKNSPLTDEQFFERKAFAKVDIEILEGQCATTSLLNLNAPIFPPFLATITLIDAVIPDMPSFPKLKEYLMEVTKSSEDKGSTEFIKPQYSMVFTHFDTLIDSVMYRRHFYESDMKVLTLKEQVSNIFPIVCCIN